MRCGGAFCGWCGRRFAQAVGALVYAGMAAPVAEPIPETEIPVSASAEMSFYQIRHKTLFPDFINKSAERGRSLRLQTSQAPGE